MSEKITQEITVARACLSAVKGAAQVQLGSAQAQIDAARAQIDAAQAAEDALLRLEDGLVERECEYAFAMAEMPGAPRKARH